MRGANALAARLGGDADDGAAHQRHISTAIVVNLTRRGTAGDQLHRLRAQLDGLSHSDVIDLHVDRRSPLDLARAIPVGNRVVLHVDDAHTARDWREALGGAR